MALAREGVDVTITARGAEALDVTAEAIRRATDATVTAVAGDITTEAGRDAALAACPAPDLLVNNAGGPPPGDFRDWDRNDWMGAVDANMISPILLIKAVIDGMIDQGFGRVVNITSGAVKSPIAILGLSNVGRAGLTVFVAGLARDVAQHGVTVNNLLPGPFETDRLESNLEANAKLSGKSLEEVRQSRMQANPTRRFGDPAEFGAACAFLCSTHAGYITGQNLLMDGGSFSGTL
jgi:3-oxoacyl-[acyl-carrier protein] reductase